MLHGTLTLLERTRVFVHGTTYCSYLRWKAKPIPQQCESKPHDCGAPAPSMHGLSRITPIAPYASSTKWLEAESDDFPRVSIAILWGKERKLCSILRREITLWSEIPSPSPYLSTSFVHHFDLILGIRITGEPCNAVLRSGHLPL